LERVRGTVWHSLKTNRGDGKKKKKGLGQKEEAWGRAGTKWIIRPFSGHLKGGKKGRLG